MCFATAKTKVPRNISLCHVVSARFKTMHFRTIFFWAWIVQGLSILPDLMLVSRANMKLGLPDHAFMIGVKTLASTQPCMNAKRTELVDDLIKLTCCAPNRNTQAKC